MPGANAELIALEVKGQFNVIERTVTVGIAVTELMGGNPERVGFLIVVIGTVQVSVGWTQEITATDGIPVALSGGSLSANVRDDFILPVFPMHGIVAAATSNVRVIEIVRETGGERGSREA